MSTKQSSDADFLVIGAGIAGVSVASHLAEHASVIVLEQEAQAAYHTTGRSAAMLLEAYGPGEINILTAASLAEYEGALQQEASSPLLTPKPTFNIAPAEQMPKLLAMQNNPIYRETPRLLSAEETRARIPLLKKGFAQASFQEPDAREIDVHGLFQVYSSRLRKRGGQLVTNARVTALQSTNSTAGYVAHSSAGEFHGKVVVNAAGAWADEVATMAGIETLGLVPKRRTIAVVDAPSPAQYEAMPMVADTVETFYLKPDAGRFLISPADETPSAAVDAQPEELDVAMVVDRVEQAFDFQIDQVHQSWAGLRSFFADGVPVCGFHPEAKGFFWLAGQGGYGIQTAPALSQLAASLLLGQQPEKAVIDLGPGAKRLSPQRFL